MKRYLLLIALIIVLMTFSACSKENYPDPNDIFTNMDIKEEIDTVKDKFEAHIYTIDNATKKDFKKYYNKCLEADGLNEAIYLDSKKNSTFAFVDNDWSHILAVDFIGNKLKILYCSNNGYKTKKRDYKKLDKPNFKFDDLMPSLEETFNTKNVQGGQSIDGNRYAYIITKYDKSAFNKYSKLIKNKNKDMNINIETDKYLYGEVTIDKKEYHISIKETTMKDEYDNPIIFIKVYKNNAV